jgi:tetratricopeptide (TPR) repeat protein
MSKQNALILALVCLAAGFVGGLGFAAYKGTPPGLEDGGLHAAPPAGMPGSEEPDAQAQAQQMKQMQDKMADLEKRLQVVPDDVALLIEAGNASYDMEQHDRAVQYYDKALAKGGENPNVLTDCGISYRKIGQPEKAVEYFRRARKADPKHVPSALNLGVVLFHDLQKPQEALAAWKEYLALDPQGPRADMIRRTVAQIESPGTDGSAPNLTPKP